MCSSQTTMRHPGTVPAGRAARCLSHRTAAAASAARTSRRMLQRFRCLATQPVRCRAWSHSVHAPTESTNGLVPCSVAKHRAAHAMCAVLSAKQSGAIGMQAGGALFFDQSAGAAASLVVDHGSISMNTVLSEGSGGTSMDPQQISHRRLTEAVLICAENRLRPPPGKMRYNRSAGGVYLGSASFTLSDLALDGNSAVYGGALYVAADLASGALLDALEFGPRNSATRGALHARHDQHPMLCTEVRWLSLHMIWNTRTIMWMRPDKLRNVRRQKQWRRGSSVAMQARTCTGCSERLEPRIR